MGIRWIRKTKEALPYPSSPTPTLLACIAIRIFYTACYMLPMLRPCTLRPASDTLSLRFVCYSQLDIMRIISNWA